MRRTIIVQLVQCFLVQFWIYILVLLNYDFKIKKYIGEHQYLPLPKAHFRGDWYMKANISESRTNKYYTNDDKQQMSFALFPLPSINIPASLKTVTMTK